MFEAQRLVFYSCISPVHMGAGQAVGVIDNPIQREVHTGHPLIAGSGLKGAIRHHFARSWRDRGLIDRLFGPEREASDHAGAIAFTDAALVAFPVRSVRNCFVYATTPTALARLKRLAGESAAWRVPSVASGTALVASAGRVLTDSRLVLEVFDFAGSESAEVQTIAEWLAQVVLPDSPEHDFFREKLKTDLVVLPDWEFGHFVQNATVVEAHVRINNERGVADTGGLFYTENLPPETLLAGLILASVERRSSKSSQEGLLNADDALAKVLQGGDGCMGLDDRLLQVGGDATTGRGLVIVHAMSGDSA